MSSSVKTIFKTLVGTVVIIVVGFLLAETFNMATTSTMIKTIANMSAVQAAQLFSQESFKQGVNGSMSSAFGAVSTPNGTMLASGNFYSQSIDGNGNLGAIDSISKQRTVYNTLFGDGSRFRELYNVSGSKTFNNYDGSTTKYRFFTPESYVNGSLSESTDYIRKNYTASGNARCPWNTMSGGGPTSQIDEMMGGNAALARRYKEAMITPNNLGIPYLESNFLTKAFKWNSAMLFGHCDRSYTGDYVAQAGKESSVNGAYISYNGFRIYTPKASIKAIDYTVFEIKDANGNLTPQAALLSELTGLLDTFSAGLDVNKDGAYSDASSLIHSGNKSYKNRVVVANIHYEIPVGYEGVTPISKMMDFIAGRGVGGFSSAERDKAIANGANYDNVQFNEEEVRPLHGNALYYIIT